MGTYQASTEDFRIQYGSGDISGLFCRDTVAIGEMALPNFTFAEVSDTSGIKNWAKMPYDGVLGLGFPELAIGGYPTVMEALVQAGQLRSPCSASTLVTSTMASSCSAAWIRSTSPASSPTST